MGSTHHRWTQVTQGKMVQRQELRVVPLKSPLWLCHCASPFPALRETEAGLPITTSSGFQLISDHFLPLPPSPAQTPPGFPSQNRHEEVAGLVRSSPCHRDSPGASGQDGDKRVSHSSSGKREDPGLQSWGRKLSWSKLLGPARCHLWLHFLLQA